MANSSQPARISPIAVFRNRSFTRIWIAQLVSTIGDSFTTIAAGIYVYRLTGSTLQVGLMLLATSLPMMLIGFFAGVLVDRYDRKKIMVVSDLIRGVLVLSIPFLIQYDVIWLYILVALSSSVSTFFHPAFDSILPEMASEEELTAANSMIAISSFGSTAIGFAASGMIAAINIEWAFYIDALTYFISALVLWGLIVPAMPASEDTSVKAVIENLKLGMGYMFQSQILRSLTIIGLIYSFSVGLWNTMLLPFSTVVLGASEFEYGIQEGLTSIGFVVGSLLMARYSDRMREGLWVIVGTLGMGIAGMLYALSSTVPVAIVFVTLSGLMNAPMSVAQRTLVQRNTDRSMRGRVFGARMTMGQIALLIGMALAGLADVIGVREMMLIGVALTVLDGVVAMLAPGIGRPAAEWLRSLKLLRGATDAPNVGGGRPATIADFDRLAGLLPALSTLNRSDLRELTKGAQLLDAEPGAVVVRYGETSDAAYFILKGKTFAGRIESGQERVLEAHNPGDFFGEIAALTGIPRTANVIVEDQAELIRVPATTLRQMSGNPELNRIFMTKMTERMIRMDMIELPKMNTLDQSVLRDLRSQDPKSAVNPA